MDSAEARVYDNSKIALTFLDSIPKPIEKYIEERKFNYYEFYARAFYELHELTYAYKNWLSALKIAENEENNEQAGDACVNIFTILIEENEDNEAKAYLKKAESFYAKDNNTIRLMELKQTPAYIEFQNENWQECINLLEIDLDIYKNLENQQYLYAFALHMMASSYFNLGNYKEGNKYAKAFEEHNLEQKDENIFFTYYKALQHYYLANSFYEKGKVDSTLYYINKISDLKPDMDHAFKSDFYKLAIKSYDKLGEINLKLAYTDSLTNFEKEMSASNVKASFELTESLFDTQEQLELASKKKRFNLIVALVLLSLSIVLFVLLHKNRRKIESKVASFKDRLSELAYLKSNQQKLSAKVNALEEYISDLKSEIKNISNNSNIENQRSQIMDLYKKIHLESADVLAKEGSHLKLINELNIDFFTQINNKYPQLNESEIIICYYLFMGFKNKEIAFFLNSSIRAIESKRYRIGKKFDIVKTKVSLTDHINEVFKDTKRNIA